MIIWIYIVINTEYRLRSTDFTTTNMPITDKAAD